MSADSERMAATTDEVFFFTIGTGLFRVAASDISVAGKELELYLDDPGQGIHQGTPNRDIFLDGQLPVAPVSIEAGPLMAASSRLQEIGVLPTVAYLGLYTQPPQQDQTHATQSSSVHRVTGAVSTDIPRSLFVNEWDGRKTNIVVDPELA